MSNKKTSYFIVSFCIVGAALAALIMYVRKPSKTFTPGAAGAAYRMLQQSKVALEPAENDILLVNFTLTDAQDKPLHHTKENIPVYRNTFATGQETQEKILHEALSKLSEGDHIQYRVRAQDWFGAQFSEASKLYDMAQDTYLLVSLHAQKVMNEEGFALWKDEQKKKAASEAAAQLKRDKKAIADYIQTHGVPAKSTPSGLHYAIDKPGFGARAHKGSTVKVHYTGRLLDGTVFDTSLPEVAKKHSVYDPQRNYQPLTFQLGTPGVIEGWQEGIALLNKGARARLLIPSGLAYGPQSVGNKIPANAVLLFDVELVDVTAEKL